MSAIARGDPETAFELSPFEYYVTSGDFDGLQSTINVVAMHDGKGGKEGLNLLSAILFFVPRSVWPEGTGWEAGVYEGYPLTISLLLCQANFMSTSESGESPCCHCYSAYL